MRLLALLLAAALLPAGALAQAPRPVAGVSAAERNAVELRQGMTPAEVQKLLGKPRRTALRADAGYSSATPQGTLQWTYVWGGAGTSSTDRTLQVDFAGKGAGEWAVNSWAWPSY